MYASRIGERDLTFHVSGKLWNNSLVMRDLQTGSLWSHLLGQCMQGELCGTALEVLPSVVTTWRVWKADHPTTSVMLLSPTRNPYRLDFYQDNWRFGYGVIVGDQPRIYSFAGLDQQPLLNDQVDDTPLVIHYNDQTRAAYGWLRRLPKFGTAGESQLLSFVQDGPTVLDEQTGSSWDLVTGRCSAGPLRGSRLDYLPLIVTSQRAWRTFHPDTQIWPIPDPYRPEDEPVEGGATIE